MEYWTIVDDRHAGPFSARQLIEMGITPDSPVWVSGLPDWVEAGEIEELRLLLEKAPAEEPAPKDEEAAVKTEPEPAVAPEPEAPSAPRPAQQPVCETPQPAPQPAPAPEQPAAFQGPQGPAAPQWQSVAPAAQAPQWEWQREAQTPDEPCPPAYLVWSIIVTILCCQPLGIAAIICSAMTKQSYNRGNLPKAVKFSDAAQWLIILSIVLGLVMMPLQLLML